jgi:hypothetical protein
MLDYAANAVVYWPVDQLRAEFEAGWPDPAEQIRANLGADIDPEILWQQIKTNLQAGRIRMLFVADRIPPELKRIVEFLNEQMDPAEVLALELRHFAGQDLKTIVPVVYGQTERAQQEKAVGGQKRRWDEPSILSTIGTEYGSEAQQVAKKIASWMNSVGKVWFGEGGQSGSINLTITAKGQNYSPIKIWTYGKIEIEFEYLKTKGPFASAAKRRDLLGRLNKIEGITLSDDQIEVRPTVLLSTLSSEVRLSSFLKVMDWVVDELRAV